MVYSIEFRPSVLKSLNKVPKSDLIQIKKKIEKLSTNLPDYSVTKLKGDNPFHRVRYGNYRIIYEIKKEKLIIIIVKIGNRKDVYNNLK